MNSRYTNYYQKKQSKSFSYQKEYQKYKLKVSRKERRPYVKLTRHETTKFIIQYEHKSESDLEPELEPEYERKFYYSSSICVPYFVVERISFDDEEYDEECEDYYDNHEIHYDENNVRFTVHNVRSDIKTIYELSKQQFHITFNNSVRCFINKVVRIEDDHYYGDNYYGVNNYNDNDSEVLVWDTCVSFVIYCSITGRKKFIWLTKKIFFNKYNNSRECFIEKCFGPGKYVLIPPQNNTCYCCGNNKPFNDIRCHSCFIGLCKCNIDPGHDYYTDDENNVE